MAAQVKVIGLDTAKHVFQVHGADASGKAILRKRLRRNQLTDFFANLPQCLVGLEATQGAHYWARVLTSFGHQVKLIAPQFVKPYLKGQKNDAQDAAAICEAVGRPEMRFVPPKSIGQQDLQALHRIRSRLIGSRTQLGNQIRGLLAEYGIVLPLHLSQVRSQLPELFSEEHPLLTSFSRELFASLYEELCTLDQRIQAMEERIQRVFVANEQCQRLAAIEGVGPLIATAMVAAVSDGRVFRNGRQFAAWLGLVPRQHSSGQAATTWNHQKRRSVSQNVTGAWGTVSRVSKHGKIGPAESVDRGEAAQDRNHQDMHCSGQQERADHLGLAGQRSAVSSGSLSFLEIAGRMQ